LVPFDPKGETVTTLLKEFLYSIGIHWKEYHESLFCKLQYVFHFKFLWPIFC